MRLLMSSRTSVGFILVTAALFVYEIWILWSGTIVGQPISMPISLAVGQVRTPQFTVYASSYYILGVETKRRLPLNVLNCMLGITTGPLDPYNCNKEPLLQVKWTLWSNGKVEDSGTSANRGGGWGADTVECVIGNFKAEKWKSYSLALDITKDGTPLAMADPRLKVHISPDYYEGEEVTGLYIFALFFLVEAIGVALLASSAWSKWRNRSI